MQGLKVKCCNCGRTDFITTIFYDPNKPPNGAMVKCLLPYHIDWLTLSTTKAAEMTCPECLAQLAPSGRLTVLPAPPQVGETKEEKTQRLIKQSNSGLYEDRIAATRELADLSASPNVGKPAFICDVCGKEIKTAGALTLHKRSHKGEATNG